MNKQQRLDLHLLLAIYMANHYSSMLKFYVNIIKFRK